MRHFDEYTLELFVLGSDQVTPFQRGEIDAHLGECHGCRSMVEELRGIHSDLVNEVEAAPAPASPEQALARREERIGRYAGQYDPPLRYRPRTAAQRLRYFLAVHPMAATAAAVSFAALFVALGMLISNPMKEDAALRENVITDWNPEFSRIDQVGMYLEVYNHAHDLLWRSKLHSDGQRIQTESVRGVISTWVEDIDGDGAREVVTIEVFADADPAKSRSLRVYDGHRRLLKEVRYRSQPSYLDRSYSPYINFDAIAVRTDPKTLRKEVLVSGNSWARSPRVIVRLDHHFDVLGEYWHFGDLSPISVSDIDGDGNEELIGIGENDNEDGSSLGPFAAMVVLDPGKITGSKRSSACPGFRLERSDAERYYLRFPASNLDSAANMHAFVFKLEMVDTNAFTAAVGGGVALFHYVISSDFGIRDVKSNDVLHARVAEWRRKGVPARLIDAAYLDGLRRGVRYWDGAGWRREATRVGARIP